MTADDPNIKGAALLEAAFRHHKSGQADDAKRLYDEAARLRPTRQLRAYWPLALTSRAPGAVGEEWASPALKHADLHINYLQNAEAGNILRTVTEPEYRHQVLVGRARIALAQGANGDALALTAEARALAPDSSYAAIIHGAALLAAGRTQDAIPPLIMAAGKGRAGAYFLLGLSYQRLSRPRDAIDAYRKAYAFDPMDFGPANNLMSALMEARKYQAVIEHADSLLTHRPGHTTSLAYKYIALGELGRTQELYDLAGDEALIQAERPPTPAGFKDQTDFHAALAREIAAEPTLAYERNTTRFGHQTDDIGFAETPAIRALNELLSTAVKRRADIARTSPRHLFDSLAPSNFRLYSWGVIIGERGHQAPHFHPHGWLSGVYYISVPPEITETDPERNGWIEFGRGDPRWNQPNTPMPVRQIRPEEGTLLTFPSFFWHNTRPLKPNKPRISFAFDVIPL